MTRRPHVVVVGSLNMDLIVRTARLPRPGETVVGDDLVTRPGGKGANQAVAAQLLGANVHMVGCVGRDRFGSQLYEPLSAQGVDVTAVREVEGASGTALIVIDSIGENMITVSPGANDRVGTFSAMVPSLLQTADALLLQMEIPLDAAAAAARSARAAGVPVLLNAAPLPSVIDHRVLELVGLADVLVVNQIEAAGLAAAAGYGSDVSDTGPLATALRGLGPGVVVVTCGASGAVLATGNAPSFHVPGFVVEAVDTVGAGDAFCAELAVAIALKDADRHAAVERACAAGALAASRPLGHNGFPERAAVDALVAAGGPRTSTPPDEGVTTALSRPSAPC